MPPKKDKLINQIIETAKNTELKSCPLCSSTNTVFYWNEEEDEASVWCNACGITLTRDNPLDVVSIWNIRYYT